MGTEIPAGYTMKDLLDNAGALLESLGIGNIDLDIEALLKQLINGTPDDEGLLTAELRGQLTGFIERVADTMGTDSNYPEDNNTTITRTWALTAAPGSVTSPDTGDTAAILPGVLILLSGGVMALTLLHRKK